MVYTKEGRVHYTDWLRKFDLYDKTLALKVRHIQNVVSFAKEIATKRGLSSRDIDLAVLIAQHHDDGRFHQWTLYKTFNDKEICSDGSAHPHADLSLDVLFEEGMIYKYAPDLFVEELQIVYKSIAKHGDLNIDKDSLSDRELLHLQIIRDADMLDNMCNVKLNESVEELMRIQKYTLDQLWDSDITDEVFTTFMSHHSINYGIIKTPADWWITWCAYLFNLSTPESLQIVKETGCVEQMFNRVIGQFKNDQINEKFKDALKTAEKYIDMKMSA